MKVDQRAEIKSILSDSLIFQGFEATELEPIIFASRLRNHGVGEKVVDSAKLKKVEDFPLVIIAEGCVAVVQSVASTQKGMGDDELDVFDALVMPRQLLGEFQFLDDPFPADLDLIAFETVVKTIEIPPAVILSLSNESKVKFYRNLAKTLVEKINIGNLCLSLRAKTSIHEKLATYLQEVPTNSVWNRVVREESDEYDLDVLWTVNKLAQYLACDSRSLPKALKDLAETGLAELVFYKRSLEKYEGVTLDEIQTINQRTNRLRRRTFFKLTRINLKNLSRFEGIKEKRKEENPGKKIRRSSG